MKKQAVIILISCIALASYFLCRFNKPYKYTHIDCIEDGLCAEGLEIYLNGKLTRINETNCLKAGKKWLEDINVCYTR